MTQRIGISYEKDSRFSNYYLEDSYVLTIDEAANEVAFYLDCVLTPSHPQYEPPSVGLQYCYRRGKLLFEQAQQVKWKRKSDKFFVDRSGEKDLGNIDAFFIFPENHYELEGDWGSVELSACRASIILV